MRKLFFLIFNTFGEPNITLNYQKQTLKKCKNMRNRKTKMVIKILKVKKYFLYANSNSFHLF